jgi:hypothetical protein
MTTSFTEAGHRWLSWEGRGKKQKKKQTNKQRK